MRDRQGRYYRHYAGINTVRSRQLYHWSLSLTHLGGRGSFIVSTPLASLDRTMHWTAYFDESGTHDSSIVIPGVIAPSEQWAAFDAEWTTMLALHKAPYVHCSEATHSKGVYAGWSKYRCDQMMCSATALIVKHISVTVTAIMRKDVHNEIFHDQRSKGIGVRQLAILFRASMGFFIDIVENHGAGPFERMDFVYEHGQKEGPLRAPFNRFKELTEYADKLGTLRFAKRTDPDASGLQAADMIAYYALRAEREEHGDESTAIEESTMTMPVDQPPSPDSNRLDFRLPITRDILEALRQQDHENTLSE